MAYEYSTLIRGVTVDAEALSQMAQGEFIEKMGSIHAQVLPGATKLLSSVRGGDWEMVSHDQLLIGGRIVVSYLVRRPEKQS